MRYDNIIPAVPGSVIVWYNHCHDSTQSSQLFFWGVCHEDGDTAPYVVPFTIDSAAGQATPFELPEMEYPETDPRHESESFIIALEIPGWGRIQPDANSPVYGNYLAQVKGYDFNFQANAKDLARRALDSE